MNLSSLHSTEGTGRSSTLRPVLAVVLATVLVPSGCMLWFMYGAMQDVSLATRQRLLEAYGGAANDAAARLQKYLSAKAGALIVRADTPPAERFHQLVSSGLADAAIIRDDAGRLLYPSPEPPPDRAATIPAYWQVAEAMEHTGVDRMAAATAYAGIAAGTSVPDVRAQALLAQARCLVKAGQKEWALNVLRRLAEDPQLQAARGAQGRLVAPSAALFALQLLGRDAEGFDDLAADLVSRLEDYTGPAMPPGQRRFIMAAIKELDPSAANFALLAAEDLAAEYLLQQQPAAQPVQVSPTSLRGVWQLAGPGGNVVGLLRQERLVAELQSTVQAEGVSGIHLVVRPPAGGQADGRSFLTVAAGAALPGWVVDVHLTGADPFAMAARRRKTGYLWTAGASIVMILALASALSYYLGRQVRLTRLKNDLIATVSHELKTPLSSMRLLIDTLLERRYAGQEQAEEYLALIAKENERLSRLIDNFLNFSRMERKKLAFQFAKLPADELVAAVMRAVPERITHPPCHFELSVADGCPTVRGDRDALVTVVLNLLDNAYKYSADPRRIALRVLGQDGKLHLAVSDNGVGLSRRSSKRVFRRFYQVDRSLSRSVGGCGLGLSIVKFIVDAHGGTVGVASRLGEGSTFTVTLPGLAPDAARQAANEG